MARERRARATWARTRLLALALTPALLAAAPPALAASPGDRTATGRFLRATLALDSSLVAGEAPSAADAGAQAAALERECPGVLAHAPVRSLQENTPVQGARARGERDRQTDQLLDLRVDVAFSLLAAALTPDREAIASWARTVSPLRWSDPRVAELVGELVAAEQGEADAPTAGVCAELSAWVASGYRALGAAAGQAGQRLLAQLLARSLPASPQDTLEGLLERYEDPAGRALMERLEALSEGLPGSAQASSLERVGTALGFAEEAEARATPRGTEIGHGRTLAGTRYTVRVERPPAITGCRFAIAIEARSPAGLVPGAVGGEATTATTTLGSPGSCALSRKPVEIGCELGVVTIEYRAPAAARSVRLRLSDGRTYTSPVVAVPAGLGGPYAIYYQSFRGEPPRAVSLTVLGAGGRVLRVVALKQRRCAAERAPETVTLAHVHAAGGAPYAIRGSSTSIGGRPLFALELAPAQALLAEGAQSAEGGQRSGPLQWHLDVSCATGGAIVDGLLRRPGDTVLAATASGAQPLVRQAIPARLHAGGSLVYGVFAAPPRALVVRSARGATVVSIGLSAQAGEDAEYCAGLSEG